MWQDGKFVLLTALGTVVGFVALRWWMNNHHPAAVKAIAASKTATTTTKKTGTPNSVLG